MTVESMFGPQGSFCSRFYLEEKNHSPLKLKSERIRQTSASLRTLRLKLKTSWRNASRNNGKIEKILTIFCSTIGSRIIPLSRISHSERRNRRWRILQTSERHHAFRNLLSLLSLEASHTKKLKGGLSSYSTPLMLTELGISHQERSKSLQTGAEMNLQIALRTLS